MADDNGVSLDASAVIAHMRERVGAKLGAAEQEAATLLALIDQQTETIRSLRAELVKLSAEQGNAGEDS